MRSPRPTPTRRTGTCPHRAARPAAARAADARARLRHHAGAAIRRGRRLADAAVRPASGPLRGAVAALRRGAATGRPASASAAGREYYARSTSSRRARTRRSRARSPPGSPSPWGQSVPAGNPTSGKPTYFGSYREVFARDLYEAFAGLLVAGDIRTRAGRDAFPVRPPAAARRLDAAQLAAQRQGRARHRRPPARRDVVPDPDGWQSGLAGDGGLYRNHVIPAADFLVAHGPSRRRRALGGAERLLALDDRRRDRRADRGVGDRDASTTICPRAALPGDGGPVRAQDQGLDGHDQRASTDRGTSSGCRRPATPTRRSRYGLGNGSSTPTSAQIVDAGLPRARPARGAAGTDPDVTPSLGVIDNVSSVTTPSGPGFYRYGTTPPARRTATATATSRTRRAARRPARRGRRPTRAPVTCGRCSAASAASTTSPPGNRGGATQMLSAMAGMTSGRLLEPEQAWEDPAARPPRRSAPIRRRPRSGSAAASPPARPARSPGPSRSTRGSRSRSARVATSRRRRSSRPATSRTACRGRCRSRSHRRRTASSVTSPTVTVSGTTAARAQGRRRGGAGDGRRGRRPRRRRPIQERQLVGHSCRSASAPTKITATATRGNSTGYAQVAVINMTLPGHERARTSPTRPATTTDPGTYAYPTSSDFQAGRLRPHRFQVNADGDATSTSRRRSRT